MQTPKPNVYAAVIIGVLSISTSAIFVKLSSASAGVIAFYRMLFTVIILAPMFRSGYRKELKGFTKKDWLYTTAAGVFLAFHFILWFESLNYTSVASSTTLVTLQPLFALAGTFLFYKERFTMKEVLCAVLAIGGSVMITWGDFKISGEALIGDVLAIIACALITGYLLIGQTIRQRVSLITYTFTVYLICAAVILVYVLVSQEALYPYPKIDWVYFLVLAILPNLLGHSLFNWTLKWISTSVISMAILFEPVGATILAYLFIGESVVWTQILGGSIIILSVFFFIINNRVEKS